MASDDSLPNNSGSSPQTTLVVQDPNETLAELTDLDRQIQNMDEEIVQRRAALRQAQDRREEMVAQLRAKIRAAYTPLPLMPLFDAGPSTDAPPADDRPAA